MMFSFKDDGCANCLTLGLEHWGATSGDISDPLRSWMKTNSLEYHAEAHLSSLLEQLESEVREFGLASGILGKTCDGELAVSASEVSRPTGRISGERNDARQLYSRVGGRYADDVLKPSLIGQVNYSHPESYTKTTRSGRRSGDAQSGTVYPACLWCADVMCAIPTTPQSECAILYVKKNQLVARE